MGVDTVETTNKKKTVSGTKDTAKTKTNNKHKATSKTKSSRTKNTRKSTEVEQTENKVVQDVQEVNDEIDFHSLFPTEHPTEQQYEAYKRIMHWLKIEKTPVFKLGGPAGSGKSWLIPLIVEVVQPEHCLVLTPTGRAATVLNRLGIQANTIHSKIYTPITPIKLTTENFVSPLDMFMDYVGCNKTPTIQETFNYHFQLRSPLEFEGIQLIIIDESSMVGERLYKDILSLGIPVLMVGDPNQLLPINDVPVFIDCDFYLSTSIRQAMDSPVIWLANQVLSTHQIVPGCYGTSIVRAGRPTPDEYRYADQVLTDTNEYRNKLNDIIRHLVLPKSWTTNSVGIQDKIICKTNSEIFNSLGFWLANGVQGKVTYIHDYSTDSERTLYELTMHNPELGPFSFVGTTTPQYFPPELQPIYIQLAYAITIHLSQGAEWDNVLIYPKRMPDWRMLYTAITRAKKSILFCWDPKSL